MLSVMSDMGVVTEKHHHEVGAAQHELGIKFGPLVKTADAMQIYKYVIHMVAQAYGKTACFMPKPVFGDNGSGSGEKLGQNHKVNVVSHLACPNPTGTVWDRGTLWTPRFLKKSYNDNNLSRPRTLH